jgi:hypothetical protein
MTQVLKHLKNSTIADGPDPNQVNPSDWNAAHVFSAGALGGLLMRDTGDATFGASWLASVVAGSVLVSNGVGAAPSWAASLTLAGTLTVNGVGGHAFVANAPGGANTLTLRNTSPGAGAGATLVLGNDADASLFQLAAFASNYSSVLFNNANGASIYVGGVGGLTLVANHTSGKIEFWTASAKRWALDNVGNLIAGAPAANNNFIQLDGANGAVVTGGVGTAATNRAIFFNANGFVGSISTSGSATAFNTTSDARLKTDRGLARDTSVLERTEIHEYAWIADGTPARGVFAQDAYTVAPYANAPGTDARDADGKLVHPWSTDYSKYVPDLIVGWQQHNARLEALERAALARG